MEAKSSRFGGRSARLHLSLIRRLGYQGTRSWRGRCLNQHDALGRDRRGSIWCRGPRSAFEEVGRPRSAIANGLSKISRPNFSDFSELEDTIVCRLLSVR